jgi:hypothetical protein
MLEPWIGQTIALADFGFRNAEGNLENIKICKKESE